MSALIGFVSIAEADAYFLTRLGASTYWTSGAEKTAALTTAYNDLVSCGQFDFSDVASGEEDADLKLAQCEQALFLLQNPDMESRLALQAQGVTAAGIVSEAYNGASDIIIAPRASQTLAAAGYGSTDCGTFTIER